ncbi:hypothetical protein MP638_003519 [Amoeboaphelidium occidentale]|nr:hypothetical protein MP638_003519 [Amoeboaphelidium occidentale]
MTPPLFSGYRVVYLLIGLFIVFQLFLATAVSDYYAKCQMDTDQDRESDDPEDRSIQDKIDRSKNPFRDSSAPVEVHFEPLISSLYSWNRFRQVYANSVRKSYLGLDPSLDILTNSEIAYKAIPVTYDCDRNTLMRVGDRGDGDGGKWICGEFLKPRKSNEPANVVFSVGSNGDFSFEESMIKVLGSNTKIYTFDCTGQWDPPSEQITFVNVCLGSSDFVDGNKRQFKSWASILSDLKIKKIDFLKMDIEGFEWVVLPAILEHKVLDELPVQISFEVHLAAPGGYDKDVDDKSLGQKLARLFLKLDKAGYYLASNEYNIVSPGCCSEFTVVRPKL